MKNVKIYALTNPITNEIRYIGKTEMTLKKRLYYHIYDLKRCNNEHKINWFNQFIKENKKPNIILIDEVPYSNWKFWEMYWISQMKQWGFNLINYTDGGEGFTSEQEKKLWKNKEYREYHTNRVKGDKNPFYGKTHSDKTKEILRKKCPRKGSKHGMYNKHHSIESKTKNRLSQPNLKPIIRLDNNDNYIDEWVSVRYMCNELNLDNGAVTRVLKGRNKTHKGFKFIYK